MKPMTKSQIAKFISKRDNNAKLIKKENNNTLPQVGMGATQGAGSDSYPYTIVEVAEDLSFIMVTPDETKPAHNYDYYSNQNYLYIIRQDATPQKYTLRKDGSFVLDGQPLNRYSRALSIGYRRKYSDPSF